MRLLADNMVMIIWFFAILHLGVCIWLWKKNKKHKIQLQGMLFDCLRDISPGVGFSYEQTIDESIEGFINDINLALKKKNPKVVAKLKTRIEIKDEQKKYGAPIFFETIFNLSRTFIQAYPMMGILGTVLAIGVGMSSSDVANVASANIMGNFASAIWSTVWGLIFGVCFLVWNSIVENNYERLERFNREVRDAIHAARIHIGADDEVIS